METMINSFFDVAIQQLRTIEKFEKENIHAAAEAVAKSVLEKDVFYTFGSGHSIFIAKDAYWRAGGLAPAVNIPEPLGGDAERLPGFAAVLAAHYELRPGSTIIVISNSGINALPLELAMDCKERGLTVVAITNRTHSASVPARHASGKKLMDIADVVVDTHGVPGDASLTLPGTDLHVGATSTILGSAIMMAIISEAALIIKQKGIEPPVIVSANMPEGDAWNKKLADRYRSVIIRYEISTVDAGKKAK